MRVWFNQVKDILDSARTDFNLKYINLDIPLIPVKWINLIALQSLILVSIPYE